MVTKTSNLLKNLKKQNVEIKTPIATEMFLPNYSGLKDEVRKTTAGTVWTSANDGTGTGLNADLLDGNHASAFQAAGSYEPANANIQTHVTGTGSPHTAAGVGASAVGHTHILTSGATDITSTATELNVLDGIPPTLTATELGYCDGVTSAIQTQLGTKQASLTGSISGTANQVTVSANSNSVASNITLSTPQSIATSSSPTFAGETIYNTSAALLKIQSTAGTGTNATIELVGGAAGADWYIGTNRGDIAGTASNLFFYNGATRIVFEAAGNVGIGTTTPDDKFQVAGNVIIGDSAAGVDYTLTFDGETNNGIITWMEDEDYFKFSDNILMESANSLFFRDTALNINSAADSDLTLNSDGTITFNGNLVLGNGKTFTGSLFVVSVTIGYGSASPLLIYTASDGEIVVDCYVEILQTWDGTGLFTIGDAGDNDGLLTDANITQGTLGYYGSICNTIASADARGAYLGTGALGVPKRKIYTTSTTINAYVTPGTSTKGIAKVYLVLQRLK